MSENRQKIKRMEPLVKAKKAVFDQEAVALASIRNEKLEALEQLKAQQQKYLEGVKNLNIQRQNGQFKVLGSLESGVDYVKDQWYEALKKVRTIEEKERNQINKVMQARQDVKSLEALTDRYTDALNEEIRQMEQKTLDELAVQKFSRNGAS